MSLPKVAIMTFGDPRDHEWNSFIGKYAIPRHQQAIEFFGKMPLELLYCDWVPRTNEQIDQQIAELKSKGAEAFIAHTSTWTWPSLVVRAVQKMGLPTVLLGNDHPGTASTVGLLGAGGALSQIGYPHIRVLAEFNGTWSYMFEERILPYLRAASAVAKLKGSVMGFFGGRSLGIDTGSFDPMQWKSMFGIDTEHIDQLEIIRKADLVEPERVQKMLKWLEESVASIHYDEKLTPEKLNFQIRCYIATKDIIKERGLDFVAIKCMPDLTNFYVPQCLSAGLLPSPYDADGTKEPVSMGCEADADGALTMEVLKHVSGNTPPLFGDVSNLDTVNNLIYMPNCGAICTWYAKRSNDPEVNMREIELRAANRPAGGCIPFMKIGPGPITLARLYRKSGKYFMAVLEGDMITPETELYENYVAAKGKHQLPTAFIKTNADFVKLIDELGSNHISGVAGSYTKDLLYFCEMMNITPVLFDKNGGNHE